MGNKWVDATQTEDPSHLDADGGVAGKEAETCDWQKKGDSGQDYFEISRREDYLSKVAILESGGILSLTLSDKKKYVYF